MSDVTRLIEAAAGGDHKAPSDLLPLVHDELRQVAAARMAAEAPDHTLNPTALVREFYLRLVGPADGMWFDGRGHFFAAGAAAMRRIFVNHARDRNWLKRGCRRHRVDLNRLTDLAVANDDDMVELDDALDRLAKDYPTKPEGTAMKKLLAMLMVLIVAVVAVGYWQGWFSVEASRDGGKARTST